MSIYGKDEKVCGTCIFWRGKRQANAEFIETLSNEGSCSCEEGFCGIKTTEASYCSDWKRLEEITLK